MDPITGAAIAAGGASLISGLFGAHKSAKLTKSENQKNRDWEKTKMQNAYQWTVEDMKKAGINPIAMYGDANGATMAGGTGTADPGDAYAQLGTNTASALSAATQAMGLQKQQAEIKNLNANTGLQGAQTGKTQAETRYTDMKTQIEPMLAQSLVKLQSAQTEKAKQETITEIANAMAAQFKATMLQMDVGKRSSRFDQELEIYKEQMKASLLEAGYDASTTAQVISTIGKTVQAVSPLSGLVSAFKGAPAKQNFYTTQNYGNTTYNRQ